jgi:hypothetical protein
LFGVLINVGSSSLNPNGRGKIFDDGTFEYLPIPEEAETAEKLPTYMDLGYSNIKFPNFSVHVDPEFETFTYGHVKRGFGDIQSILKLKNDDALFFYASLQGEKYWAPYIIGYFRGLEVYDCRNLSDEEIRSFKLKGFENNAHLKRVDPSVDLLIKGNQSSRLLTRAFRLTENDQSKKLGKSLQDVLLTASGKKIQTEKPWFRWTLICVRPEILLEKISKNELV